MVSSNIDLLRAIEAFLDESGMGESYFGKKSVGNSELVKRLRAGRSVSIDVAQRAVSFISYRRISAIEDKRVDGLSRRQGKGAKTHTNTASGAGA